MPEEPRQLTQEEMDQRSRVCKEITSAVAGMNIGVIADMFALSLASVAIANNVPLRAVLKRFTKTACMVHAKKTVRKKGTDHESDAKS